MYNKINKNVVFLSYGGELEYRRAIFCVLSLLGWTETVKGIRVIIYTDRPDFFKYYLSHEVIEYVFLTPADLENMLANTGFNHRRKVAVIDQTFKRFPGEILLFIDSDTFFLKDSMSLLNDFSPGKSFMHKREYTLKEGIAVFRSFNQEQFPLTFMEYISGRVFAIDGSPETFDGNDYSWNSGVVGLTPEMAIYMDDFYRFTDDFYRHSKWFISEQLAFSLVLQKKTQIFAADDVILHYWGQRQKALFDHLIEELLVENTQDKLRDHSFIQSLTIKWKARFELDLILEQAVIALKNRSWGYGLKKSAQLIIKAPFNRNSYHELIAAVL